MNFVLLIFVISVGINLLMFIPAFIYKTDKLTDISYAVTFIAVSLVGYIFSPKYLAQFIGLTLVLIWAFRLGIFLFIRINKIKKDSRFDGMREKFIKFLRFWLLQGITVFIILIPCVLLWSQNSTTFNSVSIIGVLVFIVGIILESVADFQKYQFKNQRLPNWIDVGVWRTSRHPNYLGEILIWIGVYLFCIPSLTFGQGILALIGPIYISVLLIFVSGVPLLEKSSDKKWSKEKAYQKYKSEVPVLLPSLSSIRRLNK